MSNGNAALAVTGLFVGTLAWTAFCISLGYLGVLLWMVVLMGFCCIPHE